MELQDIVNNDKLTLAMFNLYERWLDEHEYEDINDYAKVIKGVADKEGITLHNVSGTKRPFGIKFNFNGNQYHFYVKREGKYMRLALKRKS